MATNYRPLDMAKSMMDSALVLLDSLGESTAAAHLQQAICTLRGDTVATSIEEADALLDTPEARSLLERL